MSGTILKYDVGYKFINHNIKYVIYNINLEDSEYPYECCPVDNEEEVTKVLLYSNYREQIEYDNILNYRRCVSNEDIERYNHRNLKIVIHNIANIFSNKNQVEEIVAKVANGKDIYDILKEEFNIDDCILYDIKN